MGIVTPKKINMLAIADCLNVKLRFWDDTSEATKIKGVHWIFLNEHLSPEEKWQDFGHELCHVLQHSGYQWNLPFEFRLYQEVKAENFMHHFCVPTFMLQDYEFTNYYNFDDGVPLIAKNFNVTEEFAKIRLNQYKKKVLQAHSDEEHRRYMESMYPKAPPYNEETNKVLDQLNALLIKKGVKV